MAQIVKCLNQKQGKDFALYHGDCVDVLRQLPTACINFSIYSPPFSQLFVYSDSECDMGNATSDGEFFQHYAFMIRELARVMKPGRLIAVHCSDLPYHKWKDGFIGIKDFSGMLIQAHEDAGWILHSRRTIWKDPVVEMQRTKALGLLHWKMLDDSTQSRWGMPDYLLVFRAPGTNTEPVGHKPEEFPVSKWQEWASPVWMNIKQSNTLNGERAKRLAADADDEKHIAPLQLDLIEQATIMWSNPGDIVFSPFAGIGSEGYVALKLKRRFVGVELKDTYFKVAGRHLTEASGDTGFFNVMGAA